MPFLRSPSSDQGGTRDRPTAQQQRILVYDDDAPSAFAFAAVLRRAGYEVDVASHFDLALKILEQNPVDLLVADIVVPGGVNGLALARMARMKRSKVKVIYVTGYDIPEARESGLGPVLQKPVPDELLLLEVRKAKQWVGIPNP